ncbi:MAG: hypothetical protein ACYC56_08445 [Candidatus Aquicultor sp.]
MQIKNKMSFLVSIFTDGIGLVISGIGSGIGFVGSGVLATFTFGVNVLKPLTKNIGKQRFALAPSPPEDTSLTSDITLIVLEAIYTLKDTLGFAITVFITMAPVIVMMIPSMTTWTIASYLLQYFGVIILIAINALSVGLVVAATLWATVLNLVFDLMNAFAPIWNLVWDFIIQIAIILFNAICPGPFVPSEILNACPIINIWISFVILYYTLIFTILRIFWQLLLSAYLFIGGLICPNGICTGSICAVAKIDPCTFDIYVFVTWLAGAMNWIFTVFVQWVRLTLAFISDVLNVVVYQVLGIVTTFGISLPLALNNNTNLLASTIVQSNDTIIQEGLDGYKNVLLFLESAIYELLGIGVRFLLGGIIMIDALQCNIFRHFRNCAASKSCYALAYVGLQYIEIAGISLPFDFSIICAALGLYNEQCRCDIMIYTQPQEAFFSLDVVPLIYILIPFFATSRISCIEVQTGATRTQCVLQPTMFTAVFNPPVNTSNGKPAAYILRPYVPDQLFYTLVQGFQGNPCNCPYGSWQYAQAMCGTENQNGYQIVSPLNARIGGAGYICVGDFDTPNTRFNVPNQGVGGISSDCIDNAPSILDQTYSQSPVNYLAVLGEGIWVPCVPGQNPCSKTESILPFIFPQIKSSCIPQSFSIIALSIFIFLMN